MKLDKIGNFRRDQFLDRQCSGFPILWQLNMKAVHMSMNEIHSLDHTVILCRNMAETRSFYRDVMKFTLEVDRENWASFRVGATLLSLRPRGKWSAWDDGNLETGAAGVQLAFRVPLPAVDTCHSELVAAGVEILRAPTDLPDWRHRTLFFRDPEDNLIEIYAEY